MSKKMRAAVVGGAGFIGSHIVDALIAHGYEVRVIDDLSAGKREHLNKAAQFHQHDIRIEKGLKELLSGVDTIFLTAARPRVVYSIEHPVETFEVNVNGVLNVLAAASEAGVRRVVYSASSSAYGEQELLPYREDMPPSPMHPYGLQKLMGEQLCTLWASVYGLQTVSLRYFNVYGTRTDPEGPYALVIGIFLRQKKAGEPLTVVGDGLQTRDFTHVSDVVRANILAMESDRVGKGEIINIGRGKATTILRLAELIGGDIVHIPARLEAKHSQADVSKAKKLLGWEPTVDLEKGIKELL